MQIFIAEENGEIVGFSRVHFYGWNKSAYVISLLVNIGYRRRGTNSLDTAIDNIPALSLYFKNGFKICGYNEKLYGNAKIALYLAKEL